MRRIIDHVVDGDSANHQLIIEVTDEPGSGGANHRYEITGLDTETNPSAIGPTGYKSSYSRQLILFQNGPIKEFGVNGVTHEALLAIVIDRLAAFQKGPYPSADSDEALGHVHAALRCLQKRTKERIARGVEGTHQK